MDKPSEVYDLESDIESLISFIDFTEDGKERIIEVIRNMRSNYARKCLLSYGLKTYIDDLKGIYLLDSYESITENNLEFLLSVKADLNAKDSSDNGNTILHKIVKQPGCIDLMKTIIDNNVDVNIKNDKQETALHIAANKLEYTKLLIESGADIEVHDKRLLTPLHYAVINPECVDVLIKAGAVVNTIDKYGYSVLHKAIQNQQSVELLLKANINVNIRDGFGHTPLYYAKNNIDISSLLLSVGAYM